MKKVQLMIILGIAAVALAAAGFTSRVCYAEQHAADQPAVEAEKSAPPQDAEPAAVEEPAAAEEPAAEGEEAEQPAAEGKKCDKPKAEHPSSEHPQ